jgi:hypothetical protein
MKQLQSAVIAASGQACDGFMPREERRKGGISFVAVSDYQSLHTKVFFTGCRLLTLRLRQGGRIRVIF